MIRSIAILVHRYEAFEQTAYFMREFAKVWREQGILVTVVHGPHERVEADIAVLHVDMTAVPPEYLSLARRYGTCINGHVADISKRTVSRNLVRRNDGYVGPVIVKSDRNYGGRKEAELAARGVLPPKFAAAFTDYALYDSASEVPAEVWANPDLVVERFLTERQDGLYCLRTWMFFGSKESGSIAFSPKPVVKSESVVRREPLEVVPEELRAIRQELAFDFGTFNYAVNEERVVLFDANRTPALGQFDAGDITPEIRYFAEGVHDFEAPAIVGRGGADSNQVI
jgi:hypothetical protein